jgi:hypothetical protein
LCRSSGASSGVEVTRRHATRLHHFDRAGRLQQYELDKLVRGGLATLPPGTVHSGTRSDHHRLDDITDIARGALAVE